MPADQARGRSVPLIVVLRAEVRTETATPTVEELVLIFGGRFLDNSERLTEINGDRGPIEDKTTLHVMVRFKADGPGAPRPLLVWYLSSPPGASAWPAPAPPRRSRPPPLDGSMA